jgi:hypothetical protein
MYTRYPKVNDHHQLESKMICVTLVLGDGIDIYDRRWEIVNEE